MQLMWSKGNKYLYPRLSLTARKWLRTCVTSTPPERVFSNLWFSFFFDSKAHSRGGDFVKDTHKFKKSNHLPFNPTPNPERVVCNYTSIVVNSF